MRCLNNILEECYYHYAGYIVRYAYIFLLAPLALTALLCSGFYFLEIQFWNDTETLFSPKDGYHIFEKKTFSEHFPLDQENYVAGQSFDVKHFFQIIAKTKKNGKNLLRNDILDEIDKLNQFVLNDLSLQSYDGLYRITYRHICMTSEQSCFENPHVQILRHRDEFEEYSTNLVRYPVMRIPLDKPFYVGGILGTVTLNETVNGTGEGVIKSVGAIRMVYFMKQEPLAINYYSIQFRDALQNFLLNTYHSDLIEIAFGNDETLNDGLQQNTRRYMPQISVTVGLVFTFSFICSFVFYRTPEGTWIDWVRSKPLLSVCGILEPGLAIISAIGFLLLVGCPFNDIIVVMPFIVFAIGVDDMFIMISAWQDTNFKDPPEKRFKEALSDAGVAVSITSITDIISFGVGTWNSLPAMQMFCYYTSLAMAFELCYQLTFYAASLYLIGCLESKGLHCVTFQKPVTLEKSRTWFRRWFCLGTVVSKAIRNNVDNSPDPRYNNEITSDHYEHHQTSDHGLTVVQDFFRNRYGPILLHWVTKIFVLVLFLVYLGFSIWGSILMQNGLQPEKLVPKTHYSYKWIMTLYDWEDGCPLQILVNNPPNMSIYDNRQKIRTMVEDIENTAHTVDARFTMFWLREYERWLKDSYGFEDSNSTEAFDTLGTGIELDSRGSKKYMFDAKQIKDWLKFTGSYAYWQSCVQWSNESGGEPLKMLAFRFSVGMKDYAAPPKQREALEFMRDLFRKYAEYNLTCYEMQSPFVDQYIMIYSTTVRNTVISLALMILIALLLIPHPVCGLFMTMSVVSIDVGVSGFLAWWNVNMDCISMITMIMATGFAVDLSAHVSYAYVRAEGTANERAVKALETLGFPVFQGVTATFLGVLIMGTVDAYMFSVFFKTVFLVIIFGLMHSIIFLPVALTVFVPRKLNSCRPKKIRGNDERMNTVVSVSPQTVTPATL